MSEMYKIVRYIPKYMGLFGGNINGAKKYHGFEKAKKAFNETVVKKFAKMDKICADLIDSYCKEYYPDGAPQNFELLKQFIYDYLTNPAELELKFDSKYSDLDFEDDRVSFGLGIDFDEDGSFPFLYIDVTDEARWKFPEGIISSLCIKPLTDPVSERYISLCAGETYGLDVVFSLMTDEDEENLLFEDWD